MPEKKKESLRRRAEHRLSARTEPELVELTHEDALKLVHELRVHQEELEIQNQELIRSREELTEARDRYADLYDYAPTGYLTLSRRGIIKEANVTVCQMLGISRSELLRQRLSHFVAPESQNEFYLCRHRALENGKQRCDIYLRSATGNLFWAEMEILLESNGLRLSVTDITERKQAEQMKDDFIGMVSHELRTPLTVVLGSIKVAQSEGIANEDLKALLAQAASCSEDLSHLLDNLIELSRYQSDRLTLRKSLVDVEDIVNKTLESESHHFNDRKILVDIPRLLPAVEADEIRLRQVLLNLLDNAAKYSKPNSVIKVSARSENEHILIGVSDQGHGISEADQEKLFEPFERLRERPTTSKGLGLGLLVCKHLVEAHRGKIWVESKQGKGSTFRFTIPL